MARHNYLITGLSGTGKSSVCCELVIRGYNSIDADDTFAHLTKPKARGLNDEYIPEAWDWDADKLSAVLGNRQLKRCIFVVEQLTTSTFYHNLKKSSICSSTTPR